MRGKKYSKKEIKKFIKEINKLHMKQHKKEKFKQVIYFKRGQDINDGIYLPFLISSYGRLFSLNYHMQAGLIKEMVPKPNKDGYLHITLHHKGEKYNVRIHRLVCIAFKKNKNYFKKCDVNHKNSITSDNYIWNLEWCTPKKNVDHSFKKGNRKITYAEESNSSIYKNDDIKKVCEMLESNISYTKISEVTGVSYDTIVNILYKRQWTTISDNYDFSNHKYWKKKNKI